MATIVNECEWRVTGLSRSGNHAVLQWLMAQLRGRFVFLNCAEGGRNPYTSARPMDDGAIYRTNIPGYDLEAEANQVQVPKQHLIFSHEDSFLGRACSATFEKHHDAWVGRSRERVDILILRDPYNLFASRLRNPAGLVPGKSAMRIWKQHARQAAEAPRQLRHNPVVIAYNRWFADETYRRHIAEQLGLAFTDAGRLEVAACNGGSSFDGMSYRHHADRMPVLRRWAHYVDDPDYANLMDPSVMKLARKVFGPSTPLDEAESAIRASRREFMETEPACPQAGHASSM
ncbi:MAG: hypothetical protein WD294_12870 [Phycisphaeraceae bacterium]